MAGDWQLVRTICRPTRCWRRRGVSLRTGSGAVMAAAAAAVMSVVGVVVVVLIVLVWMVIIVSGDGDGGDGQLVVVDGSS